MSRNVPLADEPKAEDAEQAVLGICLRSEKAAHDTSRALKETDFYNPANRAVFNALIRLVDSHKPTDPVSVWNQVLADGTGDAVEDGGIYLHNLVSIAPQYSALPHHTQLVKEAGARRELARLGLFSQTVAGDKTAGNATELLDTIRKRLESITTTIVDTEIPSMGTLLEETLAEVEKVGTEGGVVGIPTGFPELDAKLNGLRPGQMIVIAGRPGMGKALALDTLIPTSAGWQEMVDIQVGDSVYAPDGSLVNVIEVTEPMFNHTCYRVVFSDGSVIVADAEHLWVTNAVDMAGGSAILTTEHIKETLNYNGNYNHTVPVAQPLTSAPGWEYTMRPKPVYLMEDKEKQELVENFITEYALKSEINTDVYPTEDDSKLHVADVPLHVMDMLREALTSSGYVVNVTLQDNGLYNVESSRKETYRTIISVEEVDSVPVKCIQVDHPDGMFLAGESFIPTHNSTIALDFARTAAFQHNKSILFFSLEMSKLELVMKLLAAQARIELTHLQSGKLSEEEWQRIAKVHEKMASAIIGIDDSPGLTIPDIRTKARGWQSRFGLDMIVVDYLQLMSSPRQTESRQQEVSEMSRNIKLIAKEFGVPVLALSQLNRGSEQRTDKKPLLSDLRESGCLTADTRVLITREGGTSLAEYITIKELLTHGYEKCLVYTFNEETHVVEKKPVINIFSTGVKLVYRLTVGQDMHIHATGNHPIYSRQQAGWVDLLSLSIGEEVAILSRGSQENAEEISWAPVTAIAELDEEEVYDLTIMDNHNFVAEGIFVHNSIEQDADVVIMVHREEVYSPETRVGEADIIIAKQRGGPVGIVPVVAQLHYSRFVPAAYPTPTQGGI